MFENLESRRLLTVTLDNGVLSITGTDNPDMLGVARHQQMIVVNDNGTTSTWNPAQVESILINGLGDADRIRIGPGVFKPITANGGEGDDWIAGATGRERLNGNAGNDRLYGGGGGDELDGGEGNDIIVGGPGHDRMRGGDGDDRFDAFDADADLLDGGDGEDWARLGPQDHAINIEHIVVRPPHPTSIDETFGTDALDHPDKSLQEMLD